MRRLFIILPLIALMSCEKQSFLQLSSNSVTEDYIPNFSSDKSFRSNQGDTITLRQISKSNYYVKNRSVEVDNGHLGEFDYVEAEETHLVIGSDTPYVRINVDLITIFNGNLTTNSEDHLTFSMDEENNSDVQKLEFTYTDTLLCANASCTFQDTLQLQLNTFYDVYYNPRDNVVIQALYINESQGLVGFKSSENKIYELISN